MKSNKNISIGLFMLLLVLGFKSCKQEVKEDPRPIVNTDIVERPTFNADSAYNYVQQQVDFGFRVPGTPAHYQTAKYLENKMAGLADRTLVQEAQITMANGKSATAYNIIGEFNPQLEKRVLLAAHWDSRYMAEKDEDTKRINDPIVGANDGASGIGVLLEIARQLRINDSDLGIDIIFFDMEDQGNSAVADSWALGSQHWAQNPHRKDYFAEYGILLDMVGAVDATFKYELTAAQNAGAIYEKTWNTGIALGYDYLFLKQNGGYVTDDHTYVMMHRGFPMIDIIDIDPNRSSGNLFGDYHHTHKDDMSVIDKNTLAAVGETVLAVIND